MGSPSQLPFSLPSLFATISSSEHSRPRPVSVNLVISQIGLQEDQQSF